MENFLSQGWKTFYFRERKLHISNSGVRNQILNRSCYYTGWHHSIDSVLLWAKAVPLLNFTIRYNDEDDVATYLLTVGSYAL